MSSNDVQIFDISNNIRTFDISFNDGVISVVIEVFGALGSNSSTGMTGGFGAYINAIIDDINPYPGTSTAKPKMFIELGTSNASSNTQIDEKLNGGYGNGGGGNGGGFTRVFYEYIPLNSDISKKVVLIAGGGGGAGIGSNGGNSGSVVSLNGFMSSGSTADGIGGGKGGNTYLIRDASGIGGINTINGGENGFTTLNPTNFESPVRAGGGGNGINGGGGGGGGFGGGGGGNLHGGGGGGSYATGINKRPLIIEAVGTGIIDISNGRVKITTNRYILPIEDLVGFPVKIAARNNQSDLLFGRSYVLQDDLYTINTIGNAINTFNPNPAFVTMDDKSYLTMSGKLYIFFNNISKPVTPYVLNFTPISNVQTPLLPESDILTGNPYITISGIVLVASINGRMRMYRYDIITNKFIWLGSTEDNSPSFLNTSLNVPITTNKIICATSTDVYTLSNSTILLNKKIDFSPISIPNLLSMEEIISFTTSSDGIQQYFITKTNTDTYNFRIFDVTIDIDMTFNHGNTLLTTIQSKLSKIVTTSNYITYYTSNTGTMNIIIYYVLDDFTTLSQDSLRKFSFVTSTVNTVTSEMTSLDNYVYFTVPSGLYIIKLPETTESHPYSPNELPLLKWFIPAYISNSSPYSFLPSPLLDSGNNIFYGIGSTLYSMNVVSMEFNWSIDLSYNIISEISIFKYNTTNISLLIGVMLPPPHTGMTIKRITVNPSQPYQISPIMPMSGNNISQTHVSNMRSNISKRPDVKYTTQSYVTDSYNIQPVTIDYNNSKYLSLNTQLDNFVDISNNTYIQHKTIAYRNNVNSTNAHPTIAISHNNTRYIHNSQKLYAINTDYSFTPI